MKAKDHFRQTDAASRVTLHRPSLSIRFATFFSLCLLLSVTMLRAAPEPGDIFREYTWTAPAGRQMVIDPNAYGPLLNPPIPVQTFHIGDLAEAVRAEIYLEIWSGHPGTSDKAIRINGGAWIPLAAPATIPGDIGSLPDLDPTCYQYFSYLSIPLALEQLQEGDNSLEFRAGPQVCYDFGWGQWGAYGITFRIYYDDAKPHPTGRVTSPLKGASLGEQVHLEAVADSPNGPIEQVDYIALYEDFDYEGNGVYRQWHYNYRLGRIQRHLGSASESPFAITWDTGWVPDQDRLVRLAARIRDADDLYYITPAVENLRLERPGFSVKLYKPYQVPPNWVSRMNQRHGNRVFVADDLSRATDAQLLLSTWNGNHGLVGVNDLLFGSVGQDHRLGFDVLPVPLDLLHYGVNLLYTDSATSSHGLEVMWPGIALKVRYESSEETIPTADLEIAQQTGWQVDSDVDTWDSAEYRGRTALRVETDGRWVLHLRPDHPLPPFGYAALRFALHPGDLDPDPEASFSLFTNESGLQLAHRPRDTVTRFIGDRLVELNSRDRLRVELTDRTWQVVEIPLRDLDLAGPIEQIGFTGDTVGHLYLADVQLVATGTAPTAVQGTSALPPSFSLAQNYPNPFNSATTIRFALPASQEVELAIFSLTGQKVVTLSQGVLSPGTHAVRWDGRDTRGRVLASGAYLYHLRVGERVETRKLLLLK